MKISGSHVFMRYSYLQLNSPLTLNKYPDRLPLTLLKIVPSYKNNITLRTTFVGSLATH